MGITEICRSSPLILINGVNRPGYIHSLDPEDIVSVEVIENPDTRHRGEETVTSIVNLIVKRKKEGYANGQLATKHDVKGLVFGTTNGSFEIGNSKSSLYLNASHFYFSEDKMANYNFLRNGSFTRKTSGNQYYNANSIYLNLGGDWIATQKDYFAFGITYITNPSHTQLNENGTISNTSKLEKGLNISQKLNNNYFTNTYSLYYKHSFANKQVLEITGKFGLFGSGSNGWRDEQSQIYAYYKNIDMDSRKTSYSLEANYGFSLADKVKFNIGSNTYYQNMRIADLASPLPAFGYSDWREYLYLGVSSLTKGKFSYSLSLGVDMVFTNAQKIKNDYVNFVTNFSLGYKFNSNNSLKVSFNRNRKSPSVNQLNPQNTSTDSLQIISGNPYLKPALINRVNVSYDWTYKWLYVGPYVQYNYMTNLIDLWGETKENIYYGTYRNLNTHQNLQAGIAARIRFGDLGNFNFSIFYNKEFYRNYRYSGNSIGAFGNLYLAYKMFSLNLFSHYGGTAYSTTGKGTYMPESEATFAWKITPNWQLEFGLRYFIPNFEIQTWTFNQGYESYSDSIYKTRRFMPMLGFSYNFKSRENNNTYRNKKQLYNTDEGLNIQVK